VNQPDIRVFFQAGRSNLPCLVRFGSRQAEGFIKTIVFRISEEAATADALARGEERWQWCHRCRPGRRQTSRTARAPLSVFTARRRDCKPLFRKRKPAPPYKGTPAGAFGDTLAKFTPLFPLQVSEARQGMLRNNPFSKRRS